MLFSLMRFTLSIGEVLRGLPEMMLNESFVVIPQDDI